MDIVFHSSAWYGAVTGFHSLSLIISAVHYHCCLILWQSLWSVIKYSNSI